MHLSVQQYSQYKFDRDNEMNSVKPLCAAAVVSSLLTACATTTPEAPAKNELSPMENPVKTVRHRIVQFNVLKGEERYIDYTDHQDDGTYTGTNSDGCSWTGWGELIAPPMSWNNCGDNPQWNSGENRDIKKNGEIWPLVLGNTVKYTYTQVDANGKSHGKRTRKCKVVEQVNLDISAGVVDAFKITCTRTNGSYKRTQHVYFSPELNAEVKYVESDSNDGVKRNLEYLRMEEII